MAITERYVSTTGAGDNSGSSEANAMTWAQMITDINTPRVGYRYNVKKGTYTLASSSVLTGDGTATSPNIIRGYDTTPGDGYLGRTSVGALNTTNMPTIAYNSTFNLDASGANFLILENLIITGTRSGQVVHLGTDSLMRSCSITNSSSNAAAVGIYNIASNTMIADCDVSMPSSVSGAQGIFTTGFTVFCRVIMGSAGIGIVAWNQGGRVVGFNTIIGGTTGIEKQVTSASFWATNNTIYGCSGDGIAIVTSSTSNVTLINNHITDCGGYGINFNTSTCVKHLFNNRFRDCTSGNYNGDGDYGTAGKWGDVTTDTGGPVTDFVDEAVDNYSLLAVAAGANAAAGFLINCGANGSPSGGVGGVDNTTEVSMIFGVNPQSLTMSPQFVDQGTIDATGEKIAWCGRFWHPDGDGTYSITRVHFCWGTAITNAGGSALTLSLQNVDTANGAPFRPDGTQDQTVAIANGSIGPVDTWFRSNALSANRSVAFGELVAAVLEFDGSGRLGSDLIRTKGPGATGGNSSAALNFTASWAASSTTQPNIIFECSDGTFGTFQVSESQYICSAFTLTQFNNASTPDERAISFIPPYTMTINAISGLISNSSGSADFDIVIYEGTTAIHTESIDGNTLGINDNRIGTFPLSANVTLDEGTRYYIALKPTTANNVRWCTATVYSGEAMRLHGWPATTGEATRTDAGAWSSVDNTKLPLVCLHVVSIVGTAALGGGVRMVNVRGGADQ